MEIEIAAFGKITEFLANGQLELNGISDTDELSAFLEQKYPALVGMKYKLAVNNTIVQQNVLLKNADTVAIMPPFSGG